MIDETMIMVNKTKLHTASFMTGFVSGMKMVTMNPKWAEAFMLEVSQDEDLKANLDDEFENMLIKLIKVPNG